jgi:hypothetical protein
VLLFQLGRLFLKPRMLLALVFGHHHALLTYFPSSVASSHVTA